MRWLPLSPSGCVAVFFAVLDVCQASDPGQGVKICANDPLNPPCTTVDAPTGVCVAIPEDYKNKVSGIRASDTAEICRFYLEPECKGDYFEAGTEAVDLYTARPGFNDKVSSFICDTPTPIAAPKSSEWTFKRQRELCTRLESLSLHFKLANNLGSGTYDKLKLSFEDAGQTVHVITEGPSPGFEVSQDIDIKAVFGMGTVALNKINKLRLLDELTDWNFGGDMWEIAGFTLKGRCANSGLTIALEKFDSLNKWLQAQPNQPGRFQYHVDWEVWSGDVQPEDWVTKSLCKQFLSMKTSICISPTKSGKGVSSAN